MCLIVFAWKIIPATPLVVAANRDEFYARPSSPAIWWEQSPHVYGGRDLQSGGTWMGLSTQQAKGGVTKKFAAITNVREGKMKSVKDLHAAS